MNESEIYKSADNKIELQVNLENDTVWLTQAQIAILFGTKRPAITKHLNNILKTNELLENSVSSILEHTATDGKVYQTKFYNLDAILSVGYRVNSTRATQFQIWATQRLRDYLVKGYAINQNRLDELQQTVQLIQNSIGVETKLKEAKGLLEIISQYTQRFVLLNQYDSNSIASEKLNENITYEIKYPEAKNAIAELKKQLIAKKEATDLFGNEKDNSFEGTLQNVVQTFGGTYLYPSSEEQAAHLLYFIIKNHSFSDGNIRIGTFCSNGFWNKQTSFHKMRRTEN